MSTPCAEDKGTGARIRGLQSARSPGRNPCGLTLAQPRVEHRYPQELERANKELRRANRELEEFAYVASHDLREPLRMVNIYSQLLIQESGANTTERARQFAKHIEDSVARMEQLIQDVLQYSRVIHEERECAFAAVSLRQALEHAIALFRDRLHATAAEIEIGDLPVVLADEMQLAMVFQNLLSNSLKYAHPHRKLSIRIWAEKSHGFWTVHFSDNGIGFEPQFGERIFGLFKRLHGSDVPGTGLGLAICRRIIERYGGEIRAEGRAERGATFIFTLKGSTHHGSVFADTTGGRQSR